MDKSDNWCAGGYLGEASTPGMWRRRILPFFAGVAVASLTAVLLVDNAGPSVGMRTPGASPSAPLATLATVRDPAAPTPSPVVVPPVASTVVPPVASTAAPAVPTRGPSIPAVAPPARSVPAPCAVPGQGFAATPTEASFAARLVGTWLGCTQSSVFGTDEVGLQISGTGRWSKITTNSTGGLTASTGWGNERTWEVVDTRVMNGPGVFQVDFHIDGSGTVISLPVFSTGAPRMRLGNEGIYADYVPAPTG